MRSLHFPVDSTTGWLVGDAGTIIKTTTSGASWAGETDPLSFTENYNDVWFVDNNNGFIVGTHGVVLATNNGGTSWARAPSGTLDPLVQFNAVDFTNNGMVGLAVGNGGAVLRTLNGGATWVSLIGNPLSTDLFGVSIPRTGSGSVAYLCGANGTILKITALQTSPVFTDQSSGTNALRAILFPGGDTVGMACGDSGTLLQTSTGTSWAATTFTPSPAAANWHALSGDGTYVYAAGDGAVGVISRTPNFGGSWTDLSLGVSTTVNAIQSPVGAGVLFAGASNNNVYSKVGSGAWSPTALPSGAPLSMSFTDALNGWVVNNQTPFTGGVFSTVDGAATWTHLYVHTKWQLRAVWFSPTVAGLGYVVGDNGTILKTTTGGQ